jgi:hypothetical protein
MTRSAELAQAAEGPREVLTWNIRLPKRLMPNCWYFLEDTTVPDFVALFTKLTPRTGEVRCNPLTRRLINASEAAQGWMITHYGAATAMAPRTLAVDFEDLASRELLRLRRNLDQFGSLKRAAREIGHELDRRSELRDIDVLVLRRRQDRLRERAAELRRAALEAHRLLTMLDARFADELGEDG